ncbi:heavy metal translocating P-type ATPase [Paenibacillus sp. MBLB4367]|uniref:heavy metal translocating P-type ATPase n=1 Tax=Paenibacillus sp. MBLB4367 TaxID=3384767 RepID=UPI003907F317
MASKPSQGSDSAAKHKHTPSHAKEGGPNRGSTCGHDHEHSHAHGCSEEHDAGQREHSHGSTCNHSHDHGHSHGNSSDDHNHNHADHSHTHAYSHNGERENRLVSAQDSCCGPHSHPHVHDAGEERSHHKEKPACGCCDHDAGRHAASDDVACAAENGIALPGLAGAGGAEGTVSVFRIDGMDCADCARGLEKRVGALGGVARVTVNFGAAKMTVEHGGKAAEAIVQTVKQAGYAAYEQKGRNVPAADREASFWRKNRKAAGTAIAGALFAAGWLLALTGAGPDALPNILYAAAIVAGGYRIAKSGLYGLKSGTIGMDLLMTIAAIGAAAIGEWAEGAAVVALFSLGETLEALTMDRTRRSIRGLMELAPNEARIRRGERESSMSVDDIVVGDVMIVKPGEKLAMDGTVVSGRSAVNEAPITGESLPVEKGAGDAVFAGTINEYGALEVEVTKLANDNTLARIVHMVEEAQAQKAPSQRFVDRFAKIYTPAVIAIAAVIAIIPPLLLGGSFQDWFYKALMMLVVSCPCALVISTPVTIVSAIGRAARTGILIKGGAHLERLGAISAIAFDKTGTLTEGKPQVTGIYPLHDQAEGELLALAAAVERYSEHPLAKAIVRKALEEGLNVPGSGEFRAVPGDGAVALVGGRTYRIGNPRWVRQELGLSPDYEAERIAALQDAGQTVMLLASEERAEALLAVADTVRANSAETIGRLREAGIGRIVMLTGDNAGTARNVAGQLGGIDYRAELLPQDKVTAIRELLERHNGVAMVGDGVNDTPALASATVGIAMGAAGTDTALETADVALMGDDLGKLPEAVSMSRKALRVIKQNIAFSLLVKAVFLALIALGHSSLWLAVLADTGSSLLVIANGMRLLRAPK